MSTETDDRTGEKDLPPASKQCRSSATADSHPAAPLSSMGHSASNVPIDHVLETFSSLPDQGAVSYLKIDINDQNYLKGHIQGMCPYKNYFIFTHNIGNSSDPGYFVVYDRTKEKAKKYPIDLSGFAHPGSLQVIGDYAVVGIEPSESDNSRSVIQFYDLTTISDVTGPTLLPYSITRDDKGAAATGISYANGRYILAVYTSNHSTYDFYKSNDRILGDPDFQMSLLHRQEKMKHGCDNMALVTETGGAIYMIAFRGDGSATIKDYADIYLVDQSGGMPTLLSSRHMVTHGPWDIVPAFRPHFRWGASAQTYYEQSNNVSGMYFICSQRMFSLPSTIRFQANYFGSPPKLR